MQTRLKQFGAGVLISCALASPLLAQDTSQQPPQRAVNPQRVIADDYLPPEYLDPNLLAIQVRRSEDRILALEETNERLVKGYNDLAEKYNQLLEYLQAERK